MALIIIAVSLFATQLGQSMAGTPPTGMCRNHPGTGFNASNFLLNRRPINDSAAKCNDGSDAQIYFRPCCNGDGPGDFCNHTSPVWLVVFGDGNEQGWCWDAASCARRAAEHTQLTSSKGLPPTFSHKADASGTGVGAFAKGGETNPNFYASYAAYIPYCSSDLFLGTCTGDQTGLANSSQLFCGKSIATAAVKMLLEEMHKYGAENIVIVGGTGIMSYIDELKAMMPTGAKVTAVCDGCVLFDDLASPRGEPETCHDAFSCTPERTLPEGVKWWKAKLSEDCGGWRCLLSNEDSGKNGAVARAAQHLPLLAQQPLYDTSCFSARGLHPTDNATFAEQVRSRIMAGLAQAKVVVASACTTPQSSFTKSDFYSVRFGGGIPPATYATGLYDLVRSNASAHYVNTCSGVACNTDCQQGVPLSSIYT